MHRPSRNNGSLTAFLLCVLLALSIWLLHNLSQNFTDVVEIPVIAESNIEGRAARSAGETQIVARCNCSGFYLVRHKYFRKDESKTVRFNAKDIHFREGETFFMTDSDLQNYTQQIFGPEVSVESFVSREVLFRFPEEFNKKVPVKAVQLVSFRPQYTARSQIRLSQDSVMVYGEPSRIAGIESILTKQISLKDLKRTAHGVVKLDNPAGVRLSVSEVDYSLDVVRYVEVSERFTIEARGVPAGAKLAVYPGTVEVVARCIFPYETNPLDKMTFYVDYDEFASSLTGKCVVRCDDFPEDLISYKVDPEVCECMFAQ